MYFFLIAVCLGVITGIVAANKGRSGFGWFIFGTLFAILALPMVLILPANQKQVDKKALETGQSRKCPFCAELVRAEATVCRYCGRDLVNPVAVHPVAVPSHAIEMCQSCHHSAGNHSRLDGRGRCYGGHGTPNACSCEAFSRQGAAVGPR